ncbi:MAG: ASCH domain-containing protein [Candidatus Delongbacteria bacterium]|nr:ASCH domain-containing protein [Candidatus Delongbacteria bacterium]
MKVLLSIKPEYANKIFAGTKKYEFRRSIFKNPNIKTIVVYSSSPVQKVIGEFEIETILKTNINDLWNLTEQGSGINKDFFFEYYKGRECGFAIKIKKTLRYEEPLDLKKNFNLTPPQSFVYIT